MNDITLQNISRNRYVLKIFKEAKIILAVLIVVMVWAFLYIQTFYKDSYKSTAKVWIKDITRDSFVKDFGDKNPIKPLTISGNPLLTQMELLRSDKLSQFVNEYVQEHYPKQQKSKHKQLDITDILTIKNKVGTDIITISLTWGDPSQAQDILENILQIYQDLNLGINREISHNRRLYIDDKVLEFEGKLKDIRNQIKEYKIGANSVNIQEEADQLVQQKINFISKLENINASIVGTRNKVNEFERKLRLKPDDAINAVALGTANNYLNQLRAQLINEKQIYDVDSVKLAPTNPKMIATKKKIERIESQIRDQVDLTIGKTTKRPKYNIFDIVRSDMVDKLVETKANLLSLEAQRNSLEGTLSKINSTQASIPVIKYTLDNLTQEEKALSTAYDELRAKQIEAKIQEAEVVSNVYVVDPPNRPVTPSFPRDTHILIIGFVAGLFLGIFTAFLKVYLEDTCEGAEDTEKVTKSPVLGTIPWLKSVKLGKVKHLDSSTTDIMSIAYKNILSNLLIRCYKNDAKVLTFTSTAFKKGTKFNSVCILAKELKKSGYSVVVIDSDFRMPTVYKDEELEPKVRVNLADLVIHISDLLKKEGKFNKNLIAKALVQDQAGVFYLMNNYVISEPYEYYNTKAFALIIQILREHFDWVLIDTSPAVIAPEFLIISRLSDGVVLLTNLSVTFAILRRIKKMLEEADIKIIGTIIRERGSELEHNYFQYAKNI